MDTLENHMVIDSLWIDDDLSRYEIDEDNLDYDNDEIEEDKDE